jgi:fructokinase
MFIIAGENLIDLVAEPDGNLSPHEGGAPYNFARALALQGVDAGYVNPFSADSFGVLLGRTLLASGARHLGRTSLKPTALAVVGKDERGQPRYSFYLDNVAYRDLDAAALRAATPRHAVGFHTGALALVPPDDTAMLQALLDFRAQGLLCTVDVNMRPQVAQSAGVALDRYRDAGLTAVGAAHVVKVSDEDLGNLGFSGPPLVSAQALLERGCRLVILTLGAGGAWAISADAKVHQSAMPVTVVDLVGAGDCFFAGFIACLHRGGALHELLERSPSEAVLAQALRHGAICAAIDISRPGCQPPTWDEAVAWQAGP